MIQCLQDHHELIVQWKDGTNVFFLNANIVIASINIESIGRGEFHEDSKQNYIYFCFFLRKNLDVLQCRNVTFSRKKKILKIYPANVRSFRNTLRKHAIQRAYETLRKWVKVTCTVKGSGWGWTKALGASVFSLAQFAACENHTAARQKACAFGAVTRFATGSRTGLRKPLKQCASGTRCTDHFSAHSVPPKAVTSRTKHAPLRVSVRHTRSRP